MKYPLELGCTLARHQQLGIVAVINARAGWQHLNDLTQEDIELARDARAIRDRVQHRVALHQVCSKFFRRNRWRIAHLISSPED